MMEGKWRFVPPQSDIGSSTDKASRKFVRKTAMKAYRQRERLQRTSEFLGQGGSSLQEEGRESEPLVAATSLPVVGYSDEVEGKSSSSSPHSSTKSMSKQEANQESYKDIELKSAALAYYRIPNSEQNIGAQQLEPFGSTELGTERSRHVLFSHCKSYTSPRDPRSPPTGI